MPEMTMHKHLKFFPVAQAIAALSKDRSTKVGALALDENFNIISAGYNGPPRGVRDDVDGRHERPTKYYFASHAESNVVAQAAYAGRSLNGATVLVTPLFPCTHCCKMLIQAGVRRVICHAVSNDRWSEEQHFSRIMFDEAGVEVVYVEKVAGPDGSEVWEVAGDPPAGLRPEEYQAADVVVPV